MKWFRTPDSPHRVEENVAFCVVSNGPAMVRRSWFNLLHKGIQNWQNSFR